MAGSEIALDRWKKSVIHLECATDSEHFQDRINRWQKASDLHREGKLRTEELIRCFEGGSRDIRFHGTAVFLKDQNRRYLVTARHVLWDKTTAKRELHDEFERMKQSGRVSPRDVMSAEERANDQIFSIIFRVPSMDELLSDGRINPPEFLMNLGAGTSDGRPYSFSPTADLAIISLDERDQRFADELENRGYEAVSLADIENQPSSIGVDVFSVGFPSAVSVLERLNLSSAERNWSSDAVSLPSFAFGKVSMLHERLDHFWCDLSVYPGNSGGPVVEGNKLVGVISGQAVIPIESEEPLTLNNRIPFGLAIKGQLVRALLDFQQNKDRRFGRFPSSPKG